MPSSVSNCHSCLSPYCSKPCPLSSKGSMKPWFWKCSTLEAFFSALISTFHIRGLIMIFRHQNSSKLWGRAYSINICLENSCQGNRLCKTFPPRRPPSSHVPLYLTFIAYVTVVSTDRSLAEILSGQHLIMNEKPMLACPLVNGWWWMKFMFSLQCNWSILGFNGNDERFLGLAIEWRIGFCKLLVDNG